MFLNNLTCLMLSSRWCDGPFPLPCWESWYSECAAVSQPWEISFCYRRVVLFSMGQYFWCYQCNLEYLTVFICICVCVCVCMCVCVCLDSCFVALYVKPERAGRWACLWQVRSATMWWRVELQVTDGPSFTPTTELCTGANVLLLSSK